MAVKSTAMLQSKQMEQLTICKHYLFYLDSNKVNININAIF